MHALGARRYHHQIRSRVWSASVSNSVLVFDAVGLALFAVSGATKALAFHLNPFAAALLGMLTGIGGGMARDILLAEIPIVLRSEVYAVAALAGSTTVVIGTALRLPSSAVIGTGGILCFGLRLLAIYRGWRLPTSREVETPSRAIKAKEERMDKGSGRVVK
jgi:uncharacterized membrane protein YeiH